MLEINDFSSIRISLASPDSILEWSYGEVTKPETINYRTLKPERDGLFCEKIFGPTRDWECYCGKYKRVRFRGVVCDKCGVTVTRSKVRRERMGHIELATPVSHIWFVKGSPSRLSLLLDITPRNMERVLYFAAYIVTSVDKEALVEQREFIEHDYDQRIAQLEKDAAQRKGLLTTELAKQHQAKNPELTQDGNTSSLSKKEDPELTRDGNTSSPSKKEDIESTNDSRVSGSQTSNFDAQKRMLTELYQQLRQNLEERDGEAVEEDVLFQSHIIVEEGRRIREASLDLLDEYYEREMAAIDDQIKRITDDQELLSSASREQQEQAVLEAQNRISEKRDRDIDTLLAEKKQKLNLLDSIQLKRILSDSDYRDLQDIAYGCFTAEMGASAVRKLITQTINLDQLAETLQDEINHVHNGPKRKKLTKRLRLIEAFRKSKNKPEWMILTRLPVIPPDLRPMVQLDGGRFATSDLNDLYRRVINRNNRLKRLLELGAPDIIVRNEKRMLQEAVDALIDNGRRGRAVSGKGKHRLKSLSDMLKGKQGRFRQNLLGKRVDYSGRSVIVVGPNLKLHQCGLPKKMALELFKPFVMQRLTEQKYVQNIKAAKKWVERVKPEVWDVLEQVIKDHLVLLNRAPSLHRLSIQAFEAILIEGSAIQLHPLVCTAFNADFDGDQMAVHVPLSRKAQEEARLRMLSKYNILSPATGDPIITPSQDIVLGCFYLTIVNEQAKGTGKVFTSVDEALLAFDKEVVDIQAPIWVRMEGVTLQGDNMKRKERDGTLIAAGKRDLPDGPNGEKRMLLETTVGRIIFNRELLKPMQYRNHEVIKDGLKNIIADCYKYYTNPAHLTEPELDTIRRLYPERVFSTEELHRYYGSERTAEQADKIKALGFHYAMRGGMTVGVQDIKIPAEKANVLNEAEQKRRASERRFSRGATTDTERYREIVQIWTDAGSATTKLVREMNLSPEHRSNPVSMMVTSQARGNINQLTQMAGMRGLMADPTGKIIELPIKSNFREGLTVLEYFVSTHGGRKGLADTALRTADAGYLTRRLIDVAQDNIVNEQDCGTTGALLLHEDDSDTLKSVADRAAGRVAAQDIINPADGSVLVAQGDEILEEHTSKFASLNIKYVYVRSALFCQAEHGICRKCYGRNLATGKLVEIGEAVGIIAAQSIGEPGTQLTLRTFHTGGVASADDITQGLPRIIEIFEARVAAKTMAILAEQDGICELVENGKDDRTLIITNDQNTFDEQTVPAGYIIEVKHGDQVVKNQILARINRSDVDAMPIRARQEGIVHVSGNLVTVVSQHHEVTEIALPANARLRDGIHGSKVVAGQLLTEGAAHPQALLEIQGRFALQAYMIKEAQRVYRPQGVQINDKHLEVIIRQMLRRVRIDEPGDTKYLIGETVDMAEFTRANTEIWAQGGMPAVATTLLHGITKASLNTDSFLSAASFQETTRVLTEAAINSKVDHLRGLKENVVIGKLIPAGTGVEARRQLAEQKQQATAQVTAQANKVTDVEDEKPGKPVATTAVVEKPLAQDSMTPEQRDALAMAALLRQDVAEGE